MPRMPQLSLTQLRQQHRAQSELIESLQREISYLRRMMAQLSECHEWHRNIMRDIRKEGRQS